MLIKEVIEFDFGLGSMKHGCVSGFECGCRYETWQFLKK